MTTLPAYRLTRDAYGLKEGDVVVWNEDSKKFIYTYKGVEDGKYTTTEVSLSKGYIEDDEETFFPVESLVEENPVKEDDQSDAYASKMYNDAELEAVRPATPTEQIIGRANNLKDEIDMLLHVEGSPEVATALVALREQYWTLKWVLEILND